MLSPSRSPGRFARRSRQRGAVGIGLILLMVSMVLFLAMAVDTGRLYMEKRKLQKQADLAALSLGRSACYIDGINNKEALETLVKQNLAANGFDTTASNPTIEFGAAQITGNEWQFEPASTVVKSAGRVTLSKTVPGSLISQLYNPNDVTLSASAAVYKRMSVGFGVGSSTARLNPDAGLLNALLGSALQGALSLDVASYKGLANTEIKLGSLLSAMDKMALLSVELSAGTLDQVLSTDISVAELIQASIDAVDENDVLDAAVLPALTQLDSLAKVSGLDLTLSDILELAAGADDEMNEEIRRAALASHIALYDLITGAIYAAKGSNAIEIDSLNVDTEGLLGLSLLALTVDATIIEPPKFTVGVLPVVNGSSGTTVETAQVRLKVGLDLPLNVLSLPGILDTDLSLGLAIDAAKAEAELLDMTNCTQDGYQLKFGVKPALASVKLGSRADVDQPAKLSATVLGGTVNLDVNLSANISEPESSKSLLVVDAEHGDIPNVYSLTENISDNLDSLLSNDSIIHVDTEITSNLGVLNILLVTVSDLIDALVNNVVGGLISNLLAPVILLVSQQVLDPLLNLLGIQVGTADVFVTSIEVDGGGLIE
ncbi:pilus assembly protein TadG-related protein [Photobacterium sp. Hal280]|uniref:pilus assembly protein TadG-related protein n=1 Tax=Photobacterium sp. Hal280 TaxID=3035163 RepID=UPI00301CA293